MDPHTNLGSVLLLLLFTAIAVLAAIVFGGRFLWRLKKAYRVSSYSPEVKMHELADRLTLREGCGRVDASLDEPGNGRSTVEALRRHIKRAEYAVALGESTGEIRRRFADVIRAGGVLRHTDREDSLMLLGCVLAFGNASDIQQAGETWRVRQDDEDDSDPRAVLCDGLAALSAGEGSIALEDFEYARKNASHRMHLTLAAAGAALSEKHWSAFDRHLVAALHEHRRFYETVPDDPGGAIHVVALGLARLARDAGYPVSARPYLPTPLLPE